MNRLKLLSTLLLLATMLFSCGKKEDNFPCNELPNSNSAYDPIDDTERMLMEDCGNNALSSKLDIESNLIGEWELVGFGDGWPSGTYDQCGYLVFSEDDLIFSYKNQSWDEFSTHQWEIKEEVSGNGTNSFRLTAVPGPQRGLSVCAFCENYMYCDATPVDGNMFLYRKVK